MKLKRYVNYSSERTNIILDTKSEQFNNSGYYISGGKLMISNVWNDDLDVTKRVKATSNNILDLVEVGDMVFRNDDFSYHIIVTNIVGDTIYGENDTSIWLGNKITAIYKRQANGDYKRYEVKA